MTISNEQLQQIVQKVYPQAIVNKAWELSGGISSETLALEIALPDNSTQRLVLCQHGEANRIRNPNIAGDGYKLLNTLYSVGFPVPKPYFVDSSNTILPTPYLLTEFVDGEMVFSSTDISTFIRKLVENLVNIHQVDLTENDLSFLPQQQDLIAHRLHTPPANSRRVVDILHRVLPSLQMNQSVLLHGDYWLGNILWRESRDYEQPVSK